MTYERLTNEQNYEEVKTMEEIKAVSVSNCSCAWIRKDGYCRMHKALCFSNRPDWRCSDGVHRAPSSKNIYCKIKKMYDVNSVKGRMQYYTRDVSGRIVFSQCTGKTRYPNWKRATEVARRRMHSGSGQLRVYFCRFCGGYHLTHKIKKEANSRVFGVA